MERAIPSNNDQMKSTETKAQALEWAIETAASAAAAHFEAAHEMAMTGNIEGRDYHDEQGNWLRGVEEALIQIQPPKEQKKCGPCWGTGDEILSNGFRVQCLKCGGTGKIDA